MYENDPMYLDMLANHKKCSSSRKPLSQSEQCTKDIHDIIKSNLDKWTSDQLVLKNCEDFKSFVRERLDNIMSDFKNKYSP